MRHLYGKRIFWILLLALGLGGWCKAPAEAASPLGSLLAYHRVEADADTDYRLTENQGPWMIMACSFSGDGAEDQARQLVLELRKRYKLPAYMHQVRFDLSEVQGRGIDKFGEPIKVRYRQGSELNEIAVLVGDYASVDDPGAQKTLQKLKYTRPLCLELSEGKPTNQSLAGWRSLERKLQEAIGSGSEKRDKGPMGHAFVTTNPKLPKEYFASPGLDPLVVEMNKAATHSLLDCPGKYTVQVATFKGQVIIDQKEIKAVEQGKQVKSTLAEAAEKAHTLAEALRLKGYDAYEFHDRYASIVTVGSFDSIGTPRPDGKTEINPKVHAIMKTFGAQQTTLPGQAAPVTPLKTLVGIPFDIQPVPIHVPRRSIARELARGTL